MEALHLAARLPDSLARVSARHRLTPLPQLGYRELAPVVTRHWRGELHATNRQ